MIISEQPISILDTEATHVVCTVNCQGHMGRGVALYLRKAIPGLYKEYQNQVKSGNITINSLWIYNNPNVNVICFPTKDKTWEPSKLEWIKSNLELLRDTYKQSGIKSVAIPPLGCSNGGLQWSDVRNLIYAILGECDLKVYICLGRNGVHRKIRMLVAGSRTITNYSVTEQAIHKAFTDLRLTQAEKDDVVIVSGLAREGPDAHAVMFCQKYGNKLAGYPAKWIHHNKAAGMIRNGEMVKVVNYGVVVYDGLSRGSKHMISLLVKHHIEHLVYLSEATT